VSSWFFEDPICESRKRPKSDLGHPLRVGVVGYEKIISLERDGDAIIIKFRDGREMPLMIVP